MRVLIAHSFYRQSGGEDNVVQQELDLLRSRHDVALLAKHNARLAGGVRTAIQMLYSRRTEGDVLRAIRSFRPDVIHLHNAYPALGPAVFLAARRTRIPLVMTVHNYRLRCPNGYMFTGGEICTRCEGGHYYNAVLHPCFPTKAQSVAYASDLWIHRSVLRLEDTVALFLCPSEFMRTTLITWGIPAERSSVIRNFTDRPSDPTAFPGSYGAYVGRLSAEKGVHVLLEALKKAGDLPFTIVGDGPEAEPLRARAAQLRLTNTSFVGHAPKTDVHQILRGARYVVLPSLWNENAPLVALEAMARGRPLIVSSVGGLRELAGDGQGHIVAPGDADALATAISSLAGDELGCAKAGAAALAFADRELTPERHLVELEDAYRRVTT